MRSIINSCKYARIYFSDPDEVHRLWRYLNLQHAIAYCGLTDFYNFDNFFKPLATKYGLLGMGKDREEEEALWKTVDLDAEGLRACAMYEVWCLDIVRAEAAASDPSKGFSPPVHAVLIGEINEVANCVKRLYAYSYQVLPFIYTHLVSAAAAAFLLFNAFIKGMYFTPEATYTFGLWMPVGHVLLTTFATFGLLEVGSTIMDPFGKDPEDFAITHLVEWTAVASLDAIAISKRHQQRRGPKTGANTYAFDSMSELRAATTLAALVSKWKARRKQKVKEQRAANRQRILQLQQGSKASTTTASASAVAVAAPPAASPAAEAPTAGGMVTMRLSREDAEQLRLLLRSSSSANRCRSSCDGGGGSGIGVGAPQYPLQSAAIEPLPSAREEALHSEVAETEHPGRAFERSGRGAAVAAMVAADAELDAEPHHASSYEA